MALPKINDKPPFNVTRASHIALTVQDLERSLFFYEQVIGLVVTERAGKTAFLRGLEEDCHHSLVLTETATNAECAQLGFRVLDDDDLEQAFSFFKNEGLEPNWADVPYQRKTLRVRDPEGVPLEFCSSMSVQPRLHNKVYLHKGGCALRFDHTQLGVPDVLKVCTFYMSIGFMASDYAETPAGDLVAVFLRRKNNPHDLVFGSRKGPQLHHFAYITETQNLMRAGDVASNLGFGKNVEYGPSRHGQDHASFVYFRDPDGHRVELLSHPIQMMDRDSLPVCRDITDRKQFVAWGPATPTSYLTESISFPNQPIREPVVKRTW